MLGRMLEQAAAATDLRARGARPPLAALHAHGRLRAAPMIVRGEGCYLEDDERQALPRRARRPLRGADRLLVRRGDGAGRARADARAAVLHQLVVRASARDRARDELAQLAPGDLNRVFFVSGGSEAVESAWKLARQYHAARGERRWKAIARRIAYHGTTMGALSINGIAALRAPFEPLVPGRRSTCATRTATTGRPTRPRRSSPRSCSTTSTRRSSRPGRRRWRW